MTTGAEWLEQARRLIEAVRGPEPAPDGDRGEHAGDCTWCPVCQFAAVLRGERPEVTAAVADLLTTAAFALREFAADMTPPQPVDEPAAGADQAAEPPRVQRIDIA